MSNNPVPIEEFRLDLSDLTYTGHDLVRPESIIAQPDGTLWISDGRGSITRIDPAGHQRFIAGLGGEPNGMALAHDGTLFVANMGTSTIQTNVPIAHSRTTDAPLEGTFKGCSTKRKLTSFAGSSTMLPNWRNGTVWSISVTSRPTVTRNC